MSPASTPGPSSSRPAGPERDQHAPASTQPTDFGELLTRRSPVTWVFAGDSITAGLAHTHGWRDYTQLFRERLWEMGRSEDVVINTAVGGASTKLLTARLEERVLRFKPDAVFIMFGTNDCLNGPDGTRGFKQRYIQTVRSCQEAGIRVIVQSTVPMMPVDPDAYIDMRTDWPDEQRRKGKLSGLRMRRQCLPLYAEAALQVARETGAMAIDHWDAWVKAGGARGELMDGGFHPNEYGHRLIAHTIFRHGGMWDDLSPTCRLT